MVKKITIKDVEMIVSPAKAVYKQQIFVRPVPHFYGDNYVKYSCPICEQVAGQISESEVRDLIDEKGFSYNGEKFIRFQVHPTQNECPCCGVNLTWVKDE